MLGWAGVTRAATGASPIGAHSMIQLDDPPSFMATVFSEASAMGASAIRLDVPPAIVFGGPSSKPDFSGLDEVMTLADEYHLRVVADLMTVPYGLADCPVPTDPGASERFGTDDLGGYASVIGQIVAHADPVIRDWEIWNEPDETCAVTVRFTPTTGGSQTVTLQLASDAGGSACRGLARAP
jgi:hypothetical protein